MIDEQCYLAVIAEQCYLAVIDALDDGTATVTFIDFGTSVSVMVDELRYIRQEFL